MKQRAAGNNTTIMTATKTKGACAAVLCWLFIAMAGAETADRIRLGAVLPLSGSLASFGADMRAGIEASIHSVADQRVDVVFADDQSDPATAQQLAQTLAAPPHNCTALFSHGRSAYAIWEWLNATAAGNATGAAAAATLFAPACGHRALYTTAAAASSNASSNADIVVVVADSAASEEEQRSGARVVALRPALFDEIVAAVDTLVRNGTAQISLLRRSSAATTSEGDGFFGGAEEDFSAALALYGVEPFSVAAFATEAALADGLSALLSADGGGGVAPGAVLFAGTEADAAALVSLLSSSSTALATRWMETTFVLLGGTALHPAFFNATARGAKAVLATQSVPFWMHRDTHPQPAVFRAFVAALASNQSAAAAVAPSPAAYEGFLAGLFLNKVAVRRSAIAAWLPAADAATATDGDDDTIRVVVYDVEHSFSVGGVMVGAYGGFRDCSMCIGTRGLKEVPIAMLSNASGELEHRVGARLAWSCCNASLARLTLPFIFAEIGDITDFVPVTVGSIKGGIEDAFRFWRVGTAAELVFGNDHYDAVTAARVASELVEENNVLAFLGCFGTGAAQALIGSLASLKIPFVSPFAGARALSDTMAFFREAINLRPAYYEEMATLLDYFVDTLGLSRIAVVYPSDTFGKDTLAETKVHLCGRNMRPVLEYPFARDGSDITAVASVVSSFSPAPQAVFFISTYKLSAALLPLLKSSMSAATVFGFMSTAGPSEFFKLLPTSLSLDNMYITEFLPDPTTDNTPLVQEYRKYTPPDEWGFSGLEGFVGAAFVLHVLDRVATDGLSVTELRAKFLDEVYTNAVFNVSGFPIGPFRDWPCNSAESCAINRCNMGIRRVDVRTFSRSGGNLTFPIVHTELFNSCRVDYVGDDCVVSDDKIDARYLAPGIVVVLAVVGGSLLVAFSTAVPADASSDERDIGPFAMGDASAAAESSYHGSSAHTGSSSNTHKSLTGAKSKWQDAWRFVSYQILRRTLPTRFFPFVVHVATMVQLAAFGLDGSLYFNDFVSRTARFADATTMVKVLRVLRYARGYPGHMLPVVIVWACVGLVFVALFVAQGVQVVRGSPGNHVVYKALKWTSLVLPACIAPACSAFFLALGATSDTSASVVIKVLAAVGLVLFVFAVVDTSIFLREIRVKWSVLATTSTRTPGIFFDGAMAVLTLLDVFVNGNGAKTVNPALCITYAAVLWLAANSVFCLYALQQPFFVPWVNSVTAGALLGCNWLALCTLVATLCPASYGWQLLIAGAAGLVPAIAGGLFVPTGATAHVRWRAGTLKAGQCLKHGFLYHILTKGVYAVKTPSNSLKDRTEGTLVAAIDACPTGKPSLYLLYSIFLLEIRQDPPHAKKMLQKVGQLKLGFIESYIAFCLSMSGTKRDANADDIELELSVAKLHHSAAKKAMAEFWEKVARQNKVSEIEAQFEVVANLSEHERAAESIFRRLMEESPNNIGVLRAFAFFLQDIRDDQEQASMLYQMADEIEDFRVKQERRSRARKEKAGAGGGVRFQVAPGEDGGDGAAATATGAAMMMTGSAAELPEESTRMSLARSDDAESDVMSTASTGFVSEGRSRLLQLKARIAAVRSKAVGRLRVATTLSMVLLAAIGVAIFALGMVMAGKLNAAAQSQHEAESAEHLLTQGVLSMRWVQMNSNLSSVGALGRIAEEAKTSWDFLARDSTPYRALWAATLVRRYIPEDDEGAALTHMTPRAEENATFWAATQAAIDMLSEAHRFFASGNAAAAGGAERQVSVRYLLDNVVQSISGGFEALIAEQTTVNAGRERLKVIGISVCTPVVVVAFVALLFGVFTPNMRKIGKERQAAAALLMDVPKATCVHLQHVMQSEAEKLEERYRSSRVDVHDKRRNTARSLTGMYVAMMGAISLLGVGSIAALYFVSDTQGDALVSARSSTRFQAVLEMMTAVNEVVVADETTWSEAMVEAEFRKAASMFTSASEDLKLRYNEAQLGGNVSEILFDRECPEGGAVECTGLLDLLGRFAAFSSAFMASTGNRTASSGLFGYITALFPIASVWLEEHHHELLALSLARSQLLRTLAAVCFALGTALAVAAFFAFGPMLRSLEGETTRSLTLLLRVPMSVLTGVDSIREFLDTGFSEYQTSAEAQRDEQEHRTKVILDASKDAVVTLNEKLHITLFNPSAEALFGYAVDDVLGQSVLPLLEKETADLFSRAVENFLDEYRHKTTLRRRRRRRNVHNKTSHEEEGEEVAVVVQQDPSSSSSSTKPSPRKQQQHQRHRHGKVTFSFGEGETNLSIVDKSGAQVPVLMSAVHSVTHDGVSFAMFVKDIRAMKEHEDELQHERRRADLLLKNILPEAVAETLKRNPEKTVAQKYESVTVLFADIVEFTPKAAGMEPTALVAMLNGIFSSWDELCVEHGVEKVKTIGDCFMAACGVPMRRPDHARRMVEFAVAALESLAEYNADHAADQQPQIQMRIGINTGPVVAGVIGKTKFQFDLWGDAVNTASRIETAGLPNRIQVSESTFAATRDFFEFESRGKIALKGKGDQEAYLLVVSPQRVAARPTRGSRSAQCHTAASAASAASDGVVAPELLGIFSRPNTTGSAAAAGAQSRSLSPQMLADLAADRSSPGTPAITFGSARTQTPQP